MSQKPEEVIKKLKNNEYATIYFLYGTENYYIDLITGLIERNALGETEKGFNQIVIYGKDITVSEMINHARRYPMMSERQVVIVKEAQNIYDWDKEESQALLNNYFITPQPSTILVIAYKNKKPDKRKTVFKSIARHAVVVESNKPYESQLPDWIGTYVKDKGHSVDLKATYMLVEYVGNDLERLANEIDKILINYAGPVEITSGIVQKYVGISKDYNSFELQRALAVRDIVKANRIVNYFNANPKTNPVIPVIALLFSFFSKLLIVHSTKDKSKKSLASETGVHPFFIDDYLIACRNYPLPKAIQNIHYIREADLRSKGVGANSMKEGEILKELVYKLLH